MTDRLTGKVVIVTGAESGIGRCIVQRCIEDGAFVTAAGIDNEALRETAEICAELGGKERLYMYEYRRAGTDNSHGHDQPDTGEIWEA